MSVRTTAASLRRAVGFLLVVFILYGTTVEAAHRHGSILPTATSTTSALTSPQTYNLTVTKVGCHDCLICQLHQNFSVGLISVRDTARLQVTRDKFFVSIQKNVVAETSSPPSGRAPPFTA